MQEGSPTYSTFGLHPTPRDLAGAPLPPFLGPHIFSLSGPIRRLAPNRVTTLQHVLLVRGARIKRSTRSPCILFYFGCRGRGEETGGRRDRDKIREESQLAAPHWTGVAMTLVTFFFLLLFLFLGRSYTATRHPCQGVPKSTRWSEHGVTLGRKEALHRRVLPAIRGLLFF